MTKSVEELEREFAREVRRFIDMAIAKVIRCRKQKPWLATSLRALCGNRSKSCPPTIKHGKA
jgi:hypothetical protein